MTCFRRGWNYNNIGYMNVHCTQGKNQAVHVQYSCTVLMTHCIYNRTWLLKRNYSSTLMNCDLLFFFFFFSPFHAGHIEIPPTKLISKPKYSTPLFTSSECRLLKFQVSPLVNLSDKTNKLGYIFYWAERLVEELHKLPGDAIRNTV